MLRKLFGTVISSVCNSVVLTKISWLLFLNGVKAGSPNKKLAMILPANIDIIEENHKERGCFLEKAIAPKTKTLIFKLNCTTQIAF